MVTGNYPFEHRLIFSPKVLNLITPVLVLSLAAGCRGKATQEDSDTEAVRDDKPRQHVPYYGIEGTNNIINNAQCAGLLDLELLYTKQNCRAQGGDQVVLAPKQDKVGHYKFVKIGNLSKSQDGGRQYPYWIYIPTSEFRKLTVVPMKSNCMAMWYDVCFLPTDVYGADKPRPKWVAAVRAELKKKEAEYAANKEVREAQMRYEFERMQAEMRERFRTGGCVGGVRSAENRDTVVPCSCPNGPGTC